MSERRKPDGNRWDGAQYTAEVVATMEENLRKAFWSRIVKDTVTAYTPAIKKYLAPLHLGAQEAK